MTSPEKFIPPEPEEQKKPEKQKGARIRRIEARPVEEVLSSKREMIPYGKRIEFESPVEIPIYEEFDAAKSFADLKEELAVMRAWEENEQNEQKQESLRKERHGKVRARIGEIRERLARQEQGIAEAIKRLRSAIEENPDESDRELFGRVAELAPEYHFSNDELREFWNVIVKYRRKHAAVERVRSEFPGDTDLYEACFGGKPHGRVDVEKRPTMLYFHCYDNEDYARAFHVAEIGGDESKLTLPMLREAFESVGGALVGTQVPELAGAVAIERSRNMQRRRAERKVSRLILVPEGTKGEWFDVERLGSNVEIDVDGVGVFRLDVLARDEEGSPKTLELVEASGGQAAQLFSYSRQKGNIDRFSGKLIDDQGKPRVYLHAELGGTTLGAAKAAVACTYGKIHVTNRKAKGVVVRYLEDDVRWRLDKKASDETMVHEEQHLINRLFEPIAWKVSGEKIMVRVAESAGDIDEAKRLLILELVRLGRKNIGIDNNARDEILAHYKEGVKPRTILKNLRRLNIYDYRRTYNQEIAGLPARIKEKIESEMSEAVYGIFESGAARGDARKEKLLTAAPLLVKPEEVQPFIEQVFGGEYKKDLGAWLRAILLLEKKGHSRDEIVSMLYGERVIDWQAFARRAPEKKKEA